MFATLMSLAIREGGLEMVMGAYRARLRAYKPCLVEVAVGKVRC